MTFLFCVTYILRGWTHFLNNNIIDHVNIEIHCSTYTDPHFQRKMYQECNFKINIRGLVEIIVSARGYGRHSLNQVIIKKGIIDR